MFGKEKADYDPEGVAGALSPTDQVIDEKETEHDAVFGEITESGPNYRDVRVSLVLLCADLLKIRRSA